MVKSDNRFADLYNVRIIGSTRRSSDDSRSWKRRPILAFLVRVGLWLLPVLAGLVSTILVRKLLNPSFGSRAMRYLWFVEMFALASVVTAIVGRAVERFLPLSTLCLINLSFPEAAPNRMKMALRVGNTRTSDLVRDFQEAGVSETPQEAAVQVLSLIEALNRHDRRTRGHSEKVRAYADVIAEEMDLSERDRNLLRWGAMLHDIGKLMVPSEILNKPGKPTDEEWGIIKEHPGAAVARLGPLREWLGDWVLAASEHHEKYDGTGYPLGLKGNQISLAGRIVAVADSFEVMTATRSYKKPMSHEAARQELVRCAGKHFDPDVVRAMVKVGVSAKAQVSSGLFGTIIDALISSPAIGQVVGTTVRTVAAPLANLAAPMVILPALVVGNSASPGLFTPRLTPKLVAEAPAQLALETPDTGPPATREELEELLGPIDPTERPKTLDGESVPVVDGGTFEITSGETQPEPTPALTLPAPPIALTNATAFVPATLTPTTTATAAPPTTRAPTTFSVLSDLGDEDLRFVTPEVALGATTKPPPDTTVAPRSIPPTTATTATSPIATTTTTTPTTTTPTTTTPTTTTPTTTTPVTTSTTPPTTTTTSPILEFTPTIPAITTTTLPPPPTTTTRPPTTTPTTTTTTTTLPPTTTTTTTTQQQQPQQQQQPRQHYHQQQQQPQPTTTTTTTANNNHADHNDHDDHHTAANNYDHDTSEYGLY